MPKGNTMTSEQRSALMTTFSKLSPKLTPASLAPPKARGIAGIDPEAIAMAGKVGQSVAEFSAQLIASPGSSIPIETGDEMVAKAAKTPLERWLAVNAPLGDERLTWRVTTDGNSTLRVSIGRSKVKQVAATTAS